MLVQQVGAAGLGVLLGLFFCAICLWSSCPALSAAVPPQDASLDSRHAPLEWCLVEPARPAVLAPHWCRWRTSMGWRRGWPCRRRREPRCVPALHGKMAGGAEAPDLPRLLCVAATVFFAGVPHVLAAERSAHCCGLPISLHRCRPRGSRWRLQGRTSRSGWQSCASRAAVRSERRPAELLSGPPVSVCYIASRCLNPAPL